MPSNADDIVDIKEVIKIPTNITLESLVDFAASIGCEVDIVFNLKSEKEDGS